MENNRGVTQCASPLFIEVTGSFAQQFQGILETKYQFYGL